MKLYAIEKAAKNLVDILSRLDKADMLTKCEADQLRSAKSIVKKGK